MKKLIIGSLLLSCLQSSAQDCGNYYYMQNNKTVEVTIKDKKGSPTGKQVYTITDAKTSGGTASSTVNSEMFDKKGKSVAKTTTNMRCNNGVLMMDMKMMMPQAQAEQFGSASASADNVYMEYPSKMNVGEQLKDGTLQMEMNNGGMKSSLSYIVTDRKVEAKESVTTPAGTWECYKITFKAKMNMRMMGIGMPVNIEGTEWYAPGFGVIKTETKGGGGTEVTSIK